MVKYFILVWIIILAFGLSVVGCESYLEEKGEEVLLPKVVNIFNEFANNSYKKSIEEQKTKLMLSEDFEDFVESCENTSDVTFEKDNSDLLPVIKDLNWHAFNPEWQSSLQQVAPTLNDFILSSIKINMPSDTDKIDFIDIVDYCMMFYTDPAETKGVYVEINQECCVMESRDFLKDGSVTVACKNPIPGKFLFLSGSHDCSNYVKIKLYFNKKTRNITSYTYQILRIPYDENGKELELLDFKNYIEGEFGEKVYLF